MGRRQPLDFRRGKSKRILRRDQPYAFNHQGDRDRSRNALSSARQKEPLERIHECVLAALALESEPVDPRL
uniref:hypothetical protein n=1 Tax=Paenibacillus sp. FSL L8-0340 TaxID=2954685 RepID=UPI00406D4DC6